MLGKIAQEYRALAMENIGDKTLHEDLSLIAEAFEEEAARLEDSVLEDSAADIYDALLDKAWDLSDEIEEREGEDSLSPWIIRAICEKFVYDGELSAEEYILKQKLRSINEDISSHIASLSHLMASYWGTLNHERQISILDNITVLKMKERRLIEDLQETKIQIENARTKAKLADNLPW